MTEDYSRPKSKPFPRDLAAGIARKASAMASALEDNAIRQMVREAQRALDRGETTATIEKQLGLK